MRNAIIRLANLEAAACCASNEETRYYLNGVCLEITPRAIFYVATDGHRLLSIREDVESDKPDHTLLGNFIVPHDKVKPFKLSAREKTYETHVTLSAPDEDAKILTMTRESGESISFKPVDGVFPDWRRCIPQDCEQAPPCLSFNWSYVASFTKAAKILGLSDPEFEPSNGGPALFHFPLADARVIGVLMPKRGAITGKRGKPAWLDLTSEPPAPMLVKLDAEGAGLEIEPEPEADRYAMQGLTAAA